ncbi:MAG: CHAP domain-containing protein [Candidatus Melainabacteria bacterium]
MSMPWIQQYLGGMPAMTGAYGFQMPAAVGGQSIPVLGMPMQPAGDQFMQPDLFGGGDYNGLNEMNGIVAQVAAETQQLMAEIEARQASGVSVGGVTASSIQDILNNNGPSGPLSGFGSVNQLMAMATQMQSQSSQTAQSSGSDAGLSATTAASGSLAEQRQAALAEAQQYVGLNEYDNNDQLQAWLGRDTRGIDNAWCALMVTKMLEKHGGCPWPYTEWVPNITQWGKDNGKYFAVGEGTPQPGDAAIFGDSHHVGFVKEVKSDGTIVTLEGNATSQDGSQSSMMTEKSYPPDGAGWLTGFVKTT